MAHPIWPLFDLLVRTPRLELRYVDDALAAELAQLAGAGIHAPEFMPFLVDSSSLPDPAPVRDRLVARPRAPGKGYGKELRQACLHLGFAGLGAEFATTGAYADNGASLGVTRHLGYTQTGIRRAVRRGHPAEMHDFRMPRAHWEEHLRRDDIEIAGLDRCLPLLGLD